MSESIYRALISVSDKTGLTKIAGILDAMGTEIISTGGTATHLQNAGIPVTSVSSVTGFPEILNGRVKTLHPSILGAILGDSQNPDHVTQMEQHGIKPFQLVIVNLYPFRETVTNSPENSDDIIENIDIGGPCLIRAAAKNFKNVLILTHPDDYDLLAERLEKRQSFSVAERRHFAMKAFSHTSQYDFLIQNWMNTDAIAHSLPDTIDHSLPDTIHVLLEKTQSLRYGENPHQIAGLYRIPLSSDSGVLGYRQHSGKEISFNNLLDTQAAWRMTISFEEPAAVVVKHQNPCGAAIGDTLVDAMEAAFSCDPTSAFGGIVALNRTVDRETAAVLHSAHFLEVIAAPGFEPDALDLLCRKKNRRIVELSEPVNIKMPFDIRMFHNGALVQAQDDCRETRDDFRIVTDQQPSETQWRDLLFGWKVCQFVKSNAIVCANSGRAVGVGAGQMSRVDAVEIALKKASDRSIDSVLASDAFFPFSDSIELAAHAGIKAIIQPGGSKGDSDVIQACNTHGIAMVFTGIRHFRH